MILKEGLSREKNIK